MLFGGLNLAALKPMIIERIQKQKANVAYRKQKWKKRVSWPIQKSDSLAAVSEIQLGFAHK